MPIPVIYICAAMLFLGVAPLPYGYYMLLRLTAFSVFGIATFVASDRKRRLLPWAYGFMAVLFNPVFKVTFPKEIWVLVDIAAGIFLLVTATAIRDLDSG